MFVTISKYPNGANLETSAYFKDNIKNKWPIVAKKPIPNIIYHSLMVGWTHTVGIIIVPKIAPTTPVNKRVKSGLSELCNFLVTIKGAIKANVRALAKDIIDIE